MPQLTIGDKTVTVGDEFLKLSPEQQNATVEEIAASIGAKPAAAPAPAAPAAPVSVNDVARSAATGVPIVGGLLNKLNAGTNAALAPALNRFFSPENQLAGDTFGERFDNSLRQQEGMDKKFSAEHPIVDTGAKLAGGVASMVPAMAAAPAAFGLTGSMSQMVGRGAASGAALSATDAAVRGEDVGHAATVGGIVGGAAGPVGKGVGKVVSAIADRVRPAAPVAQNTVKVGNVDVPLSQAEVTQNPALSAEQQIMLRGGRGDAAQNAAQGFKDLQESRIGQAGDDFAASLDPTGGAARTSPQDAAERIASELIAQEQGRQAAAVAQTAQVGREGQALARGLDPGGQVRAPSAFDAAETLSDRLAAGRDAAKADYRGKYRAVAEQPGEFAPGSAAGFRNDVDAGLRAGENPVSLDPTNTPKALRALQIIDDNLNAVGPGAPKPAAPAAGAAADPQHAQTVADIRAKFGDDVAAAYDRQKSAGADGVIHNKTSEPAPKAQSLLEFIASKRGLGPGDAELEAIGGHNHTVNVEGVGRRKLVRQGGWPLDYAREAAEEAGYLRGDHKGTSTVNDLLDAMDAEMRGQKRYPEGFEAHVGKRETAARSEREQHDHDAFMRGLHDDLTAAGHGELGPDVKDRAVKLMANERMGADDAVEHAFRQLEQEDAAIGRAAGFPGDRPAPAAAAAAPQAPGSSFTMRDVEQVRKQLSTLYGDARRAMMAGGSGSDLHALEAIRDHFDARVAQMIEQGKFGGDGPAVLRMQEDARASFADYKQKFAKRGAGDEVGAAVEKILGKFSDTKATPDTIIKLAYGSGTVPGGQMPVQIVQRIERIFGRASEEFATYKQGLFAQLTHGEPEAAAARIEAFLTEPKGRVMAQTVFSDAERASLSSHAGRLRGIAPQAPEAGAAAAAIRRYSGADGAPPAAANQIVNDLFGSSGKGNGRFAVDLALRLKQSLTPDGWASVRQGMFEKLTNAGEGKIAFEAQALSQRLHEFLNESGSQLARALYSPQEIALLKQLAGVYKQMIPVKGTTNPSGTAPMLAKMAGGLRQSLLPLLGMTHGGLPGAAVGALADKGLTAVANAGAARKATSLFYGPQAVRPVNPNFAKVSGLLSQGEENQRRARSK